MKNTLLKNKRRTFSYNDRQRTFKARNDFNNNLLYNMYNDTYF